MSWDSRYDFVDCHHGIPLVSCTQCRPSASDAAQHPAWLVLTVIVIVVAFALTPSALDQMLFQPQHSAREAR